MKALVVYASRLGSTEGIAVRIAQTMRAAGIDVTTQRADRAPDVAAFDAVVAGGGVYGQRWHADAAEFVRRNAAELSVRPVWLFGSGPLGDSTTRTEPSPPKDLAELATTVHARAARIFSGALDRSMLGKSDLGFFERAIANRFLAEGDWRDWDRIEAWAAGIASEVGRRARRVPAEALT